MGEIIVPVDAYERLRVLSGVDAATIRNTISEIRRLSGASGILALSFILDTHSLTDSGITAEVELQRALLLAVASGTRRLESAANEYGVRQTHIRAELSALGLDDLNPYNTLQEWDDKWSTDLPTYGSRKEYIQDLYDGLLWTLRNTHNAGNVGTVASITEWTLVDRQLGQVRSQLLRGNTEEQFQTVGLLCRETLISLAQTVYDAGRHPTDDGTMPSNSDGKRMLAAYIAAELAGSSNEAARRHAKAALDFANDLQHRRTANFRQAALCAEATSSVVNVIAIISGKRDP